MTLPPLVELCPVPRFVVWDITYACPLRCSHCYSESGRRPSRQLAAPDLLRIADALVASGAMAVVLAGGEPLVVRELFEVTERFVAGGLDVILYTGGWNLTERMVPDITRLFAHVTVSIDGATADVHDQIRGRQGSFERALAALAALDRAIADARQRGQRAPQLGIDYVVMKRNFGQLRAVCTDLLPRFAQLSSVSFGAVIPTGLASRPSFEQHELLDDAQARELADGALAAELQALAPPGIAVSTSDNRRFQLHPELIAAGMDIPPIQIEPDGMVRAMPIYEGVIGNLLDEPLRVLWARAIERWSHPAVLEALSRASTIREWAEATRAIDLRFGTPLDLARIAARPTYVP